MIKKLFAMLSCAVVLQMPLAALAAGAQPAACQLDEKYLLGLYTGNGEQLLVREQNGTLSILYRYLPADKDFQKSNVFPLVKEHYDAYQIFEAGALTNAEGTVNFERDKAGHGISCNVGGNRYTRSFFGPEKGDYFKVKPTKTWEELHKVAEAAVMPAQTAPKAAELVNLAAMPGLKFDLRYATGNNCFSAPLYIAPAAYLDKNAAEALGRVQHKLADYGYGLLVWDAYRPWKVSKLAYEALPENYKTLLPAPEKGFSHNTGNAVDVSLYDLKTGEPVQMISDFDEPSPRQYSSFAGGTTLERWERDLLQQVMTTEGFTTIETEWWHFDYDSKNNYQMLDIPFTDLH